MSPYKAFLNNTRQYFNTNGFLRFLLSGAVIIFAVGGGLFVLGSFLYLFFGDFFTCTGIILMLAGLLLTVIKEDMMALVITSGSIAFGSLIAWIYKLVSIGSFGYALGYLGFDTFNFYALFYFMAFGAIALLVFLKAEKFKQMRAASAARAQMAGLACPRCGAFVPMNAVFCPSCGAQNPAMQQYAVPVQPQYAPPVQPQYAPPVQPQYAPPAQPQYTAPAQPQYAPPAPPAEPEATATAKCVSCGEYIPAGAAFCSKCGAKQ